ncbi:hypothetical protein ACK3TF_003682 [Chlorella vulgaris]
MGKGLRSNSKRRYRTLRRDQVEQAPWQVEAEAKRQEELAAVLAAPRPSDLAGGEGGDAATAGMEGVQQAGDAAMAVDGQAEGNTTTTNPAKLLKRMRKQRLATTKGIVKGQAKRSKPLSGPNQFHKKKKKKH